MAAKPYIELYIDNKKVYFKEPPEIFITYSHSDLHNPTVVKNSFSKTITVEGTPQNNAIFGCYYDMTRLVGTTDGKYSGAYFNAARKVEFTLLRNQEVVETGYVKLDKVTKRNGKFQYELTLYGGLGQFFYNLTYNEDGEQLKLSDLTYSTPINLKVNKETINNAWLHLSGNEKGDIYNVLNFAPCYNGIPKNFTSNKVAINADMLPDDFKATIDLTKDGYTTVNGWMLGEFPNNLDEWKTFDLRSYLQRPVIRWKTLFNSFCDKANNGGYTVDLDTEFFNTDNPYWEDAWLTLPLLNEVIEERGDVNNIVADGDIYRIEDGVAGRYYNVSIPIKLGIKANANAPRLETYRSYVYTGGLSIYLTKRYADVARYFQLVLCDADGNVIKGGPIKSFHGSTIDQKYFNYEPEFDTVIEDVKGSYVRTNDEYIYTTEEDDANSFFLELKGIKYEEGMYLKIVEKIAKGTDGDLNPDEFGPTIVYDDNKSRTVTSLYVDKPESYNGAKSDIGNAWVIEQKTMLNSEHTPCDYFLSYIKMFNLHIWKDMFENIIYIRQRKNFFINEVTDIDGLINRDDEITITPLTFENKWLNFNNTVIDSTLAKDYKNMYGVDYGIQKVDTNYNFDSSSKNVFEKSPFKTTVENRGQSRYYNNYYLPIYSDAYPLPPYTQDGVQTYLFKNGETTEGSYISPKIGGETTTFGFGMNYDKTPKPCFVDSKNEPVDGSNVLLFFNGCTETKNASGKYIRYWITDDLSEFQDLNDGEPMWIWTSNMEDSSGNKIALNASQLPMFGRYKTNENNWITHSFDFGTPRAIYIPDYTIDNSSSIYSKYWKPYISDMYNANTRVVKCKVLLKERVIGDYLRKFYYFDNGYWILNKVEDYNITSNNCTQCEFVKVNDINNYLS